MKPTKENIETLKRMGFRFCKWSKGDTEETGWWRLKNGWEFRIDSIKDIPTLVERVMETGYHRGKIDILNLIPIEERYAKVLMHISDKVLYGPPEVNNRTNDKNV